MTDLERIRTEIQRLQMEFRNNESFRTVRSDTAKEFGDKVLCFIKSIEKNDTPSNPPGIEEEKVKKGWLDYGLTMSEIGLHRENAIRRINEHKDTFETNVIPLEDLYHVSEYYKAVGAELILCCLQAWCKDFLFTTEEVKDIIEKEQ